MSFISKITSPRIIFRHHVRRYNGVSSSSPSSKTGDNDNKSGSNINMGNKDTGSTPPSSPIFFIYDARKYSHSLPGNDVKPPFEIPKMPSGVFRCTSGEVIGPQAGKCANYRNPEYYSFHHMSFYDMQMVLLPQRQPQIATGRKPTII